MPHVSNTQVKIRERASPHLFDTCANSILPPSEYLPRSCFRCSEMVFPRVFNPNTLEFQLVIGFKFVGELLIGNQSDALVECKLFESILVLDESGSSFMLHIGLHLGICEIATNETLGIKTLEN